MDNSIWQKSGYSASSNECVEVRARGEVVELRESDDPGTMLGVDPATFLNLLESIKASGFDQYA
ncbi:DUF397 domain-containing protein [Kitasatospora purpeofusca]|uniref:DUF397 domain-containing protein n=1 Tax=Kitasatospora purpeofusca TaxID=67352 RepID=UPI00382BB244